MVNSLKPERSIHVKKKYKLEIDHSDENERICELKKQGVDDYDIIDIPF